MTSNRKVGQVGFGISHYEVIQAMHKPQKFEIKIIKLGTEIKRFTFKMFRFGTWIVSNNSLCLQEIDWCTSTRIGWWCSVKQRWIFNNNPICLNQIFSLMKPLSIHMAINITTDTGQMNILIGWLRHIRSIHRKSLCGQKSLVMKLLDLIFLWYLNRWTLLDIFGIRVNSRLSQNLSRW